MSLVYIRSAANTDLPDIMHTISEAKSFLKQSGGGQWQENYPTEEAVETNIKNRYGLILIVDNQIAGYAAGIVGGEPTYQKVDGVQKNKADPYATFYCLVVNSKYQGMYPVSSMFSGLISIMINQKIRNFRVGTSQKNEVAQYLVVKHSFIKRGIIQVGGDPKDPSRLVYELNI